MPPFRTHSKPGQDGICKHDSLSFFFFSPCLTLGADSTATTNLRRDAEHSKGIGHSPAEAQKHTFQMPQEYPQELKDAIEDGMPIYKALEPKKVRLP